MELALETVDRVQVFYAGHTIEDASVDDFEREKLCAIHIPEALWRAMPKHGFHYIGGVHPYVKDNPVRLHRDVTWHRGNVRVKFHGKFPGSGYVRCILLKLEVRDLSFWYEEKGEQILSQFSLSADSSERVGIIAPSGFGKQLCRSVGCRERRKAAVPCDGKTQQEPWHILSGTDDLATPGTTTVRDFA